MNLKKFAHLVGLLLLISLVWTSCRKKEIFTSSPVTLRFSTDTVFFDTIFSKLVQNDTVVVNPRSITLQVRVTNPASESVRTSIKLAGNPYGIFRLNVDGRSGSAFSDIEIPAGDSIYIFVQAYIDQVNSNTPFIVTDQILFETNGSNQDVDLVAWAQDANYYQNYVLDCASSSLFWTATKPYVIYDSILVPKGCTLTIDAGAHIYNYNRSCFLVAGTLIVNGTPENPVVFEGSRLDDDYKELPGQWIGIRFLKGSINNRISGAIIRNGYIGIEVDSLPENNQPGLILEQSIIRNMSAVGLLNYSAHIKAENNLIANPGLFSFIGELGGTYELSHNTFYIGNTGAARKEPGFYLSNAPSRDLNGTIQFKIPLNFQVRNNIIVGNLDDEVLIYSDNDGLPITHGELKNNLFKTLNGNLAVGGNILNTDPGFKDAFKFDFDLRAGSRCRGAGTPTGTQRDLKNRFRSTSNPSIGAYEGE
ncbi:hypothetical protein MASR2M44_27970 [Bacteroidota bacterium]